MKTTLLLLMLTAAIYSVGQGNKAEMTSHKISYSNESDLPTYNESVVLASPKRDTIYMVKGTTAEMIVSVWMTPAYINERPVFTYISLDSMKVMRDLPYYIKKD